MDDTVLAPGIVMNPERQGGRPTVAGTRITVEHLLDKHAAGRSIDDILVVTIQPALACSAAGKHAI
jgi:uncharacterized protein (DUF433 family)